MRIYSVYVHTYLKWLTLIKIHFASFRITREVLAKKRGIYAKH